VAEQWRRFREKLRQCDAAGNDLDGSEVLPIVVGEATRWIRLDRLVVLARSMSRPETPPPAPPPQVAGIVPGTICPTFDPPPSGWLLCDGRAVSRSQYPKLFALIGETHGKGDGKTTFNLPSLKSNLALGKAPEPFWMIAA
jgi:hypothetical protein